MTGTALDLTGVACPMNWVRTKLALEKLDPGDELDSAPGRRRAA